MTDPEVYQDHEKSLNLTTETNELKQEAEDLMETWAGLQEEDEGNCAWLFHETFMKIIKEL